MDLEILLGEWMVQTTYWMAQPWGLTPGGQVPLAGLKTSGINNKAVRNLASTGEEHAHACLLPKQGRGRRLKLPGTLVCFLQLHQHVLQPEMCTCSGLTCSLVQLHTRARVVMAKESALLWGMEPAQTWHSIWKGWGRWIRSSLGLWLVLGPHSPCSDQCWVPAQAPLFSWCSSTLGQELSQPRVLYSEVWSHT